MQPRCKLNVFEVRDCNLDKIGCRGQSHLLGISSARWNTGSPLKLLKSSTHVLGWTPIGAERGREPSPSSRWGSGDLLGARKAALVYVNGAPRSTYTPLKLPKEGPLGWSTLTEKEATEYTRCISGGVEARLRLLKYGVPTDSYRSPVLNVEIAAEISRDLGGDIEARCRLEKYEGLDETVYQKYIMELEAEPEVKVPYERVAHFERLLQKKISGRSAALCTHTRDQNATRTARHLSVFSGAC
ncbi:hypothetical protein CYMTET_52488 [Cymbomonas tetramitiformis]|uniref:Uncharacterized protein n=1 Tax=Cymbomonas tetramitiformis TaxID=36881 RepID=A0AAE0BJ65_9CHLO|nr:hypothetical protein CYMTET_52488 [Cymbomonas tetramitiformis]